MLLLERKLKSVKSQYKRTGWWGRDVKWWTLEVTRLFHPWTHSSCTISSQLKILAWREKGALEAHTYEELLAPDAFWGMEAQFSLEVKPLVGWHLSWSLDTHVYMSKSNWTQWVNGRFAGECWGKGLEEGNGDGYDKDTLHNVYMYDIFKGIMNKTLLKE